VFRIICWLLLNSGSRCRIDLQFDRSPNFVPETGDRVKADRQNRISFVVVGEISIAAHSIASPVVDCH